MPGIWGPKGQWIEFGEIDHRSLVGEVATAAAVGEDVGGMLSYLPDPDPVLRKRGDDAKVLEDLASDDQVITAIQNRKLRVLNNSDYDFTPGLLPGKDATPQATALCEELTKDLENISLRNVFSEILDAPFYGYTIIELMWEADGGKFRLADIVAKPREWFTWDADRRPCLKPSMGGDPKPLPGGKFIIIRHFPTYKNPYGLRLLSRCLWPVAFKRGGVRFYTRFLDRFGQPWVLGKSPKGTDLKTKQEMAADLSAMVQDAVAVIPATAEVTLVESKGKAGSQFEEYLQRWDKAISKVLMGQTLTSEMDGQGSRAASETHYTVADDMSEADQAMIEAAMNDLALIYRDINAETVEAPVFGYNEPEDSQAQADLDVKLYSMGVRFTRAHVERRFGLQPDEFTLAESSPEEFAEEFARHHVSHNKAALDSFSLRYGLSPVQAAHFETMLLRTRGLPPDKDWLEDTAQRLGMEPVEDAGYAEGDPDHQDALDALVAAILPDAAKRNATFTANLVKLLGKAESFEDMQLLLAEHLGQDADMQEQEDLLADLMTAAELMGRAAVRGETDEG